MIRNLCTMFVVAGIIGISSSAIPVNAAELEMNLGVRATIPMKELADVANSGPGLNLGLGLCIGRQFVIGAELGMARLGVPESITHGYFEASHSLEHITGYAKFSLRPGSIAPYLKAGVGSYSHTVTTSGGGYAESKRTVSDVGVLLGGGTQFRISETVGGVVEANTSSFTSADKQAFAYYHFGAGLLFTFGS